MGFVLNKMNVVHKMMIYDDFRAQNDDFYIQTGTIPEEFRRLNKLEFLDLQYASLSDSLGVRHVGQTLG